MCVEGSDRHDVAALNNRFRKLTLIVLAVFLIILGRLFYLQVVRAEQYKELALSNRIRKERVIAPRGFIRDRKGKKLVVNIPVYQICILPQKAMGKSEVLSLACRLLRVDEERLRDNMGEWIERYSDGREMPVIQAADKEQISILMENREFFTFFKLVPKHRRQYPDSTIAAHVLGYVGEVTDDELGKISNYYRGDMIGRTGIEYTYEHYLKGIDGERLVEISADGVVIGTIDGLEGLEGAGGFVGSKAPVPGRDIYLTIDIELQHEVERVFTWEKGAIVIMDPRNGEILAAVSRPTYDPNMFIGGISEVEWQKLFENPANPLFNRTVQATYPPGSVFKLVTAYAALSNRIIGSRQYLKPCYGSYRFGNRNFGCWRPEGHGSVSMREAIEESCDVYFYQLGELLSADQFGEAGLIFGFGKKSGIDLPSEAVGIIPDHAYFDRRFGKRKWTRGHLLNYAIGQGEVLCTPLQICLMGAIFANGGNRVQPHIVSQIVDFDGRSSSNYDWEASDLPMLDKQMLRFIRGAMERVVSGEHGTGRASAVPGLKIAGKTGTSQNPHGEDHALFVAYAPADDPVIVAAIVMENAGHGGAMAAPLARQIFTYYFYGRQGD